MGELRQDPSTLGWVLIAPQRRDRPAPEIRPAGSSPEGECPFCPGHEAMTPPELWRQPAEGPWRVRVFPNRYPMLGSAPSAALGGLAEPWPVRPAEGSQEVIVESPEHDWDLVRGGVDGVLRVLQCYRHRFRALQTAGAKAAIIFRNHGAAAGTSLSHPHSQVAGMASVPAPLAWRSEVARQHFQATGRPLYEDIVEAELAHGRRVVAAPAGAVAFEPFAPGNPFETWIVPRSAAPDFGEAGDSDLEPVGATLLAVLTGLRSLFGDFPYNLVLSTPPFDAPSRAALGWHLRIVPRLAVPGGFELETGMPVNPWAPEEAAAELRARMPDPAAL